MTIKERKEAGVQTVEGAVRQELTRLGYAPPQIDEMVRAATQINRGRDMDLSAPWMQRIVDQVCELLRERDTSGVARRLREDISIPYARLSTGTPPVRAVPTPARVMEREYIVSIDGTRYYLTLTGAALTSGQVAGMDTQHQLLQAIREGRVSRVTDGTNPVPNFARLYQAALEDEARISIAPRTR
jgi:hypothetical protein